MDLIIVESPTKARTLTRFLGRKYQIEATMGHIRDLPKSTLGVDLEHEFKPHYVVSRDRAQLASQLKKIATKADSIILATDPDREGEAIAWHVAEILSEKLGKLRKSKKSETQNVRKSDTENLRHTDTSNHSEFSGQFQRIVFHEITEHAIKEALEHPREIDLKLVDAQQARRVLDRLVGYKLSPLLWQKLSKRWLSAGRVQSVAVRLVVEREREIAKFQKQEYWTIEGVFHAAPDSTELKAQLVAKDGVKYEKTLTYDLFDGKYTTTSSVISDQPSAVSIINDLKAPYTVSAVDKKEVKRYPLPPYTTSTLQQDAGRKLYFSAKKIMQLAQQLYEEGIITYHRTDSVNLAEKFITEAREFIGKNYGDHYLPASPRRYQTKSKVAQEAHEAIRPTDVRTTNEKLQTADSGLNRDHLRLYELIWKRAVASQAAEAIFDSTTIVLLSHNGYRFETQGSVIKFDGFLRLTGREDGADVFIPKLAVGEEVTLAEAIPQAHQTLPPPRYSEASLIKTLEEKGIGRPSTYAPIISTIMERQYIEKSEKKLIPTELGGAVTDFLVQYFPEIMNLPFTAEMEDKLDEIASGQKQWAPIVKDFYVPFAQALESAYTQAQKVKMAEETINEPCPKCGSPLVIRRGRYGKFIACSTFPQCDYTRQLVEKIGQKCPRCTSDIVIKKSRRGKIFYGCSNYPACTFAAWKKEDIK